MDVFRKSTKVLSNRCSNKRGFIQLPVTAKLSAVKTNQIPTGPYQNIKIHHIYSNVEISTSIPSSSRAYFTQTQKNNLSKSPRRCINIESIRETETALHPVDPVVNSENIHLIMAQIFHDYNSYGELPDTMIPTSIQSIKYWVETRSYEGLQNAVKILLRLLDERTIGGNFQVIFPIDIVHNIFNLGKNVGGIYSDGADFSFSHLVVHILNQLEHIHHLVRHAGDDNILVNYDICNQMLPTLKTYNMVLDILSKSKRDDAIEIMHGIVDRMDSDAVCIIPDNITFNSLLHAYANDATSKNSAKKCEALLRHMQRKELFSSTTQSNDDVSPESKPLVDTISYNIVMHTWAKSDDDHAARNAENLLLEMQDRYNKGNKNIQPNFISFTTVINAWGKCKDMDAAERAENILLLMKNVHENGNHHVRANIITYNAVLNAWSRSNTPGAARRAENLLSKMLEWYRDGNPYAKPDKISFSICISSWVNSDEVGASAKALNLLKRMQDLAKYEGFDTWPDIIAFNAVLSVLGKDSDQDKASKAENILRQMEADSESTNPLGIDLHAYNNVIRCCSSAKSESITANRNALRIATETLLKIRHNKNISPDPFTFNFFIKAVDRLSDDKIEKKRLITAAFQFCIESGQFSPPVLSILRNVISPAELRDMLGLRLDQDLRTIQVSDFPSKWSDGIKTSRNLNQFSTVMRNRMKRDGRRKRSR